MSGWVDCRTGPSYIGGWTADMGPYTGPWPLLPPGVVPKQGDFIYFYVGLPNPAHPDDPFYALDGYDSPVWASYRYQDGPDLTSYFFFWNTLGSLTTLPPTPPPGCHLWVSIDQNPDDDPPPHPPSYYVPRSYAAGGNAAFQTDTGGWSDWQPGPVVRHAAHLLSQFVRPSTRAERTLDRSSGIGEPPPPPFELMTWDAEIVAEMQARIAAQTLDVAIFFAEILWAMDTRKEGFEILGSVFDHWVFELDASQQTERWTARTTLDPINLGGLVYGVDYGQSPYPEDYDAVASEAPVSVPRWVDVANYIGPASGGLEIWYENPAIGPTDYSGAIDISIAAGDHLVQNTLDDPRWLDTSAFTLTTVDLSYTIDWTLTDIAPPTLAPSPLPLTSLLPAGTVVFTICRSASFLRTGPPSSASEISPDPARGESGGGAHYMTAGLNFADMFTDHTEHVEYTGLAYDAINPRWHYWIPGAIIPSPTGSYLRFDQRNDGTGISRHPRLSETQGSTSTQSTKAPRIGGKNIYS